MSMQVPSNTYTLCVYYLYVGYMIIIWEYRERRMRCHLGQNVAQVLNK